MGGGGRGGGRGGKLRFQLWIIDFNYDLHMVTAKTLSNLDKDIIIIIIIIVFPAYNSKYA